jgi:hypothetical protein
VRLATWGRAMATVGTSCIAAPPSVMFCCCSLVLCCVESDEEMNLRRTDVLGPLVLPKTYQRLWNPKSNIPNKSSLEFREVDMGSS